LPDWSPDRVMGPHVLQNHLCPHAGIFLCTYHVKWRTKGVENRFQRKARWPYIFCSVIFSAKICADNCWPNGHNVYRPESLCVDDCLVCRLELISIMHNRQSSTQSDKCQVSHRYRNFSWWWAHSCSKHVGKRNKHTKKKLCMTFALFVRLYKDARSTKHKKVFSQLYFTIRTPIHRTA
jgi:hypothetical protein